MAVTQLTATLHMDPCKSFVAAGLYGGSHVLSFHFVPHGFKVKLPFLAKLASLLTHTHSQLISCSMASFTINKLHQVYSR